MTARAIRLHAPTPTAAPAALVPRITTESADAAFWPRRQCAHSIDDDDGAPTLRAYASLSDGGPVSITMTSVPIHARLERACVGGRTDLTD